MTPRKLRALVWNHYRTHGRHDLPWRKTHNPYRIMVSEIMLQQTQVERVIPYYQSFLRRFPSVQALAEAPLKDVLALWQGLGYNRRAKLLWQAAQEIVERHSGRMPRTVEELQALPGIGPYTARAIAAFAYDMDTVFVETNLRTVVIYHFFPDRNDVSDTEILAVLQKAYPGSGAREWYAALMDYGSALKRQGIRTNTRTRSYVRQSSFEGSRRQARGAILRALIGGPRTASFLVQILGDDRKEQLRAQLASLTKEGLIELRKGKFQLPD